MQSSVLKLDSKVAGMLDKYLPEEEIITELKNVFFVFDDYTRLKILSALTISEMCVTDLSVTLNINQTTVSHQLRILRDLGAVSCKREGKVIYYSLSSELLSDIFLKAVEFLAK